jgi:hypothetical protein
MGWEIVAAGAVALAAVGVLFAVVPVLRLPPPKEEPVSEDSLVNSYLDEDCCAPCESVCHTPPKDETKRADKKKPTSTSSGVNSRSSDSYNPMLDPFSPLNPISPLSPLNPMGSIYDSSPRSEPTYEAPSAPAYEAPSSDYGGGGDFGGSSGDSGSCGGGGDF